MILRVFFDKNVLGSTHYKDYHDWQIFYGSYFVRKQL